MGDTEDKHMNEYRTILGHNKCHEKMKQVQETETAFYLGDQRKPP